MPVKSHAALVVLECLLRHLCDVEVGETRQAQANSVRDTLEWKARSDELEDDSVTSPERPATLIICPPTAGEAGVDKELAQGERFEHGRRVFVVTFVSVDPFALDQCSTADLVDRGRSDDSTS
jgi:hypothetical protein